VSEGEVHCRIEGGVAAVTFDRPSARNAMTWAMYDGLARACREIAENKDVRVAVFRGAGGEAFVAGTDIAQFTGYTAEDGVRYEQHIATSIERIEQLSKPTIAVVEGWCTGGGLIIAAACDFRIAANTARFGVPIARTLGNCLSVVNVARLIAAFGVARAKRMLMLAEMIGAEEALACGFVHELVSPEKIEACAQAMYARLKEHAPLTMQAAKEAMRRIVTSGLPDDEDLIRICYGSSDFQAGIAAFLAKTKPNWTGE
jgi:enoyl-CoA hydratase/carnithine racemase